MNKIATPTLSIKKFYKALIKNSLKKNDNGPLKPHYEKIEELLIYEEKQYISKGKNGTLNDLPAQILPIPTLSIKEMEYLYTKFIRDLPQYYYSLKSLPYMQICPYCEKRDVTELDHYLPKSYYPMYVITPANLIPSCHECNKSKQANTLPLVHPYFDDTTHEQWMKCDLDVQYNMLIPKYKITFKNLNFSTNEKMKIVNTVNTVELHILYSTWASTLISNKIKHWKKVWSNGDVDGLISFIESEYESINTEIYSINSYKKVFYKALIEFLKSSEPNFSFLEC